MSDPQPIIAYAKKLRAELGFSSEKLAVADNAYVAWLDLMGAGHIMSVSVQKSANFLVRLHMAVDRACNRANFGGKRLPINDGIFLISTDKSELVTTVRDAMALIASIFIATPRPHDRFFVRGGIAFGPVYFGTSLAQGITRPSCLTSTLNLDRVAFGPPIIQAFQIEHGAPPFGIALHESARAFASPGAEPFRLTHWLWWESMKEAKQTPKMPPLAPLKDCLQGELKKHFQWMDETALFHGVTNETVSHWRKQSEQYFRLG